ncbi:MAG: hemerythrin family protein [Desulfamplus sp.]|nr:hemerythrin family protein [Desulfamplus sp.]MBF0413248.1 hemerythrin family protein [Desulfamplus sp.]
MIEEDNIEDNDLQDEFATDDNEIDDGYESDEYDADNEADYCLKDKEDNKALNSQSNSGYKIEWEQSLSVDIPEIDELQKRVFMMLNGLINQHELDEEMLKDAAAMVAELTEYSRYYFSKEEEYLRRCGYPDIDCHSKEHRQFIKNTINLRRQVSEDKKNLSYQTVSNLKDWLVSHISGTDHVYVPFVRINNYVEECRLKR